MPLSRQEWTSPAVRFSKQGLQQYQAPCRFIPRIIFAAQSAWSLHVFCSWHTASARKQDVLRLTHQFSHAWHCSRLGEKLIFLFRIRWYWYDTHITRPDISKTRYLGINIRFFGWYWWYLDDIGVIPSKKRQFLCLYRSEMVWYNVCTSWQYSSVHNLSRERKIIEIQAVYLILKHLYSIIIGPKGQ